MARTAAYSVLLSLLVIACAPGEADPDQVAIRLEDERMTLGEFQAELNRRGPERFEGDDADSVASAFAESLLDKMILSREARASVRGDTTGLARYLHRTRVEKVKEILRDEVGADLTAERLETMFSWTGEEVRVRHIQVASYAAAREIKDLIDSGTSFESLVEERSMDAFSKANGGEMPWFAFGEFAGVDEAAFALEVGGVSEPVLSRRGWHVLRLEERRPRDEARPADARFEFQTRERLIQQRLGQRTVQLFETEGWSWNPDGIAPFVEGLLAYVREAQVMQKELDERREAGETITPEDYARPRAPEFPADVAALAVAVGPSAKITVADVADIFANAPAGSLPRLYDEATASEWVRGNVLAEVAERWATNGGFAEGSEAARRLRDAEEFVFVELLYRNEVQSKVRPTDADRREFFESYRDSYRWRADLDLTVVRTADEATAADARSALVDGADAAALTERFAADSTFRATQLPRGRDFELPGVLDEVIPGLNSHVRTLPDEVGGVTVPQRLGERFVVARIDGVGETAPMTFEEAEPMVTEHCTSYLREIRLRAFLDSLRTVYRASVDTSVVVQVTWPSKEPS